MGPHLPQAPSAEANRTFGATVQRSGVDRERLLRDRLTGVTEQERKTFTRRNTTEAETAFCAMEYLVYPTSTRWPRSLFTRDRDQVWQLAAAFIAEGIPAFAEQFTSNYPALELDGLAAWRRIPQSEKAAFFDANDNLRGVGEVLDKLDEANVDARVETQNKLRPVLAALACAKAPLEGMRRAIDVLASEGDLTVEVEQHKAAAKPSSRARVASSAVGAYQRRAYADVISSRSRPPGSLVVTLPVSMEAALQAAQPGTSVAQPSRAPRASELAQTGRVTKPTQRQSLIVKLRYGRGAASNAPASQPPQLADNAAGFGFDLPPLESLTSQPLPASNELPPMRGLTTPSPQSALVRVTQSCQDMLVRNVGLSPHVSEDLSLANFLAAALAATNTHNSVLGHAYLLLNHLQQVSPHFVQRHRGARGHAMVLAALVLADRPVQPAYDFDKWLKAAGGHVSAGALAGMALEMQRLLGGSVAIPREVAEKALAPADVEPALRHVQRALEHMRPCRSPGRFESC